VTNIETVLVHRDVNTKRMYLHSVATKEYLLNHRVSSADTEVSERSGSPSSGDIASVLRGTIDHPMRGIARPIRASNRQNAACSMRRPRTKPRPLGAVYGLMLTQCRRGSSGTKQNGSRSPPELNQMVWVRLA
jgi:hypothetical protein